jgi:folate-binding protein YgfZ
MPNSHLSSPPASVDASRSLAAARDAAVVCDLAPLHILAVSGADATTFLQGQLSCDVATLPSGAARLGSFNSPKGRMLANFVLWRDVTTDGFAMLLAGDIADSVSKRLRMYVLRSKVQITDISQDTQRVGIGGPSAAAAVRAVFEAVPAPLEARSLGNATLIALPGDRFVALAPKADADLNTGLAKVATPAPFDVWRWLTVRSGVPVITAATQDAFVAQAANLDILGGIDFQKGCYTGQEIIARTHYLGRLKERTYLFHTDAVDIAAGEKIYSSAFEGQASGTVINAAPAPGGGSDLLAVLQVAAAERNDAHLFAPDGPPLEALPLPYEIPAPSGPRGRRV